MVSIARSGTTEINLISANGFGIAKDNMTTSLWASKWSILLNMQTTKWFTKCVEVVLEYPYILQHSNIVVLWSNEILPQNWIVFNKLVSLWIHKFLKIIIKHNAKSLRHGFHLTKTCTCTFVFVCACCVCTDAFNISMSKWIKFDIS